MVVGLRCEVETGFEGCGTRVFEQPLGVHVINDWSNVTA